MSSARDWLMLGIMASAVICTATAYAEQPAPAPTPPKAGTVGGKPAAPMSVPDDGFIEFLGSDDVGDAALWEFLKKAPQRVAKPRAAPPQDAKQ